LTRTQRLVISFLSCLLYLSASPLSSPLHAQDTKPADYSKEGFVIEQKSVKLTFENDGTYSEDTTGRIKIQSQAGIEEFGVVTFPYASATTNLDVVYVRVVKPDKQVVNTPAENILDMPADITRQAPFYSDLKGKQVAVKGLEVGDTLEFHWHAHVYKPLDPGQFWINYNFFKQGIELEEDVQILVPRGRYVKVKSPLLQPTESDQGAYHVYTWKTSHLNRQEPESPDPSASDEPDIQMTSFRTWDEVGQWIQSLFGPEAIPTPEIRAKAAELTQNAKTGQDKIEAIYNFVSENFRYIGISLGIGRYQPHEAAEVLTNEYGDCKDKHTLFTALLAAAGVKAYPALINSGVKIDPDVPSPAQFDHVITALPQDQGFLFLDTTPEVAPYGFLIEGLRGKKALVVPGDKPTVLAETPLDPPFPNFFKFQAEGSLDADGALVSDMQMTFRGDSEIAYRIVMRQSAQPQWKDVMQQISSNLGFGGTVSDVTATSPDATNVPFHIGYKYTRKEYSDWSNKRISIPFPPIFITPAPDESDTHPKPIKLGSPAGLIYQATIKLPEGANPQIPQPVNLSESFGEYHALYSFKDGVLVAERHLTTKARQIDPNQIEAYRKFVASIVNDENTLIPVFRSAWTATDTEGSPEARGLYEKGREAWEAHDMASATDYLQRAVDNDPKFAQGWLALGGAHFQSRDIDMAVEAWKKVADLDPSLITKADTLTPALVSANRIEDAVEIWREVEKTDPENPQVHQTVGTLLAEEKRYPEAVAELEKALEEKPNDPGTLEELGAFYIRTNQQAKGVAAIEKSIGMDDSASMLNYGAYELADYDLKLEEALKYAQRAVDETEDLSAKISVDKLSLDDLRLMPALAAYWDTLGWVYFRQDKLDLAEQYLKAAWNLGLDAIMADHLGQLYEKEGNKHDAARAYSSALAAGHAPDETEARLKALLQGAKLPSDEFVSSTDLQDMRTVRLGKFPGKPSKHSSAEFFLLMAPGPEVVGAKFISGSDDLRQAASTLKSIKVSALFPDKRPTQIVRRGVLDCEPEVPGCILVLIPANLVHSLN